MEPLTEAQILHALRAAYSDIRSYLSPDPANGRLSGTLTSEGFKGRQGPHRQQSVWKVLREAYGPDATTVGYLRLQTEQERTDSLVGQSAA